ncbi:MAG: trimethylamine methyltransferase family protein [Anaerolineae bacterium]
MASTYDFPQDVHELLALSAPPPGGAFNILSSGDVERLADAVLTVLDKVGVSCQSREILKALDDRGARVDYGSEKATFPRSLVQAFVEELRKEQQPPTMTARAFQAPPLPWTFHPLAVFYYDYAKRGKQPGNRESFITMTQLGDVLHPEHGTGHCLILSEEPAAVEPLEAALLLCQYAHKPRGVYIQDVRQIPYLEEMEDIAGIEDKYWHWLANVSFATPLRLGKEIADRFVYMVRSGRYPAQVYNFAVCGVNMPATAAGSIALASAEIVALWLMARALNPRVSLNGGLVEMASADMRTGEISYWAFDAVIRSLSTCEFLRKWTGVAVSAGGGEYNPSTVPGSYVALEKAYRAMTLAAFTGGHPTVGIGHLEAGLSLCPVQLLLDRDISAALRFLEPPVINDEAIGLEAMLAVGHGEAGTYLEAEHTLRHFRTALWQPQFLDRQGWSGMEAEERLLERAQAKVDDLLAQYQRPEFDSDKLVRMRKVVDKARKALL